MYNLLFVKDTINAELGSDSVVELLKKLTVVLVSESFILYPLFFTLNMVPSLVASVRAVSTKAGLSQLSVTFVSPAVPLKFVGKIKFVFRMNEYDTPIL